MSAVKKIVVRVKGFLANGSITKSRNVRGKLTTIMDDLLLANKAIQEERDAKEAKWMAEIDALVAQVEKLQAKIDGKAMEMESKNNDIKTNISELCGEEIANQNLYSGLEKLING